MLGKVKETLRKPQEKLGKVKETLGKPSEKLSKVKETLGKPKEKQPDPAGASKRPFLKRIVKKDATEKIRNWNFMKIYRNQ